MIPTMQEQNYFILPSIPDPKKPGIASQLIDDDGEPVLSGPPFVHTACSSRKPLHLAYVQPIRNVSIDYDSEERYPAFLQMVLITPEGEGYQSPSKGQRCD
jgi:hypothetical protein